MVNDAKAPAPRPCALPAHHPQARLNTTYSAPLDQASWAGIPSVDAAKIKISEGHARLLVGHIAQTVTVALNADIAGSPKNLRFISHILPGRMVNAGCLADVESFDSMKAVFEKTLTSLKPL